MFKGMGAGDGAFGKLAGRARFVGGVGVGGGPDESGEDFLEPPVSRLWCARVQVLGRPVVGDSDLRLVDEPAGDCGGGGGGGGSGGGLTSSERNQPAQHARDGGSGGLAASRARTGE